MNPEHDEPTSYKSALAVQDSEKCLGSMKSEMEFIFKNQVWDLVDMLYEVTPNVCKWVFKLNTNKDENISVFNVRLVAKGYKQVHGIEYNEIFLQVLML